MMKSCRNYLNDTIHWFDYRRRHVKINVMDKKQLYHVITSLFLCIMVLSISETGNAITGDTVIKGVRIGLTGTKTRFVIDSEKGIKPNIFMLASPRRLVIDVPNATWEGSATAEASGSIDRYRYGQWKPGIFRLVLDLNGPVKIDKLFTLKPNSGYGYRTVFDLQSVVQAEFLRDVANHRKKRQTLKPVTSARNTNVKRVKTKRIVFIDPGHGGHDPGNLGVIGIHEKNVVLAISKQIKKTLDVAGRYDVRLTRNSDFFVDLRERYRLAQRVDADLFISVHADSFTNKKANGGTVYTLAEKSSDKETALLVQQHNNTGEIGGLDVETESPEVIPILLDLAMREKMNASAQFAEILLPELQKSINMRKIAHRSGPFLVLKDPVVPSILLETGYLSNKNDAKFIASSNGRKKIAGAVSKGVDAYFRQLAQNGR